MIDDHYGHVTMIHDIRVFQLNSYISKGSFNAIYNVLRRLSFLTNNNIASKTFGYSKDYENNIYVYIYILTYRI